MLNVGQLFKSYLIFSCVFVCVNDLNRGRYWNGLDPYLCELVTIDDMLREVVSQFMFRRDTLNVNKHVPGLMRWKNGFLKQHIFIFSLI